MAAQPLPRAPPVSFRDGSAKGKELQNAAHEQKMLFQRGNLPRKAFGFHKRIYKSEWKANLHRGEGVDFGGVDRAHD
jgi:hypothetical protein